MTEQIGNHGLFCLDNQDYAAFALAMQCNAQATDAALDTVSDSLTAYLNRPYISFTNTTQRSVSANSGFTGPTGVNGATLGPFGNLPVTNGIPTDEMTPWPRGIYMVGTSITWTVASPTANTVRWLGVYGVYSSGGFESRPNTVANVYFTTDYEGTTSGGSLTTVGFLRNDGNMIGMEALFHNTNTGGPLIVPIGSWRGWAMYLGSGQEI